MESVSKSALTPSHVPNPWAPSLASALTTAPAASEDSRPHLKTSCWDSLSSGPAPSVFLLCTSLGDVLPQPIPWHLT